LSPKKKKEKKRGKWVGRRGKEKKVRDVTGAPNEKKEGGKEV